jgi:nucleotide-binding universal stress UspA family protein
MFHKILLPVDLTAKHQRAVDVAADLATQSGGQVTLVHVIEEIRGVSKSDEPEFFQRLETAASNALDAIAQRLHKRGIACERLVRYGDRVREVVRYAKNWKCDLIIVTGPRFDSKNPSPSWASLSWKIGMLAPCPVLLVK